MKPIEDFGIRDFLTWIIICGVSILVIDYNWKRRWLYYHASKIKGPLAFPFIGSLYCAARVVVEGKTAVVDSMLKLAEKYGHTFQVYVGNRLFVFVSKPNDIELVLKKCLTKGIHYEYLKDIVGNSILTSPVEIWKDHRKLINQTFNQSILNSYVDIFVDHSNALIDRLRANCLNKQVNIWPEFCKTTFGIVCDTAMGIEHHTIIKEQDRFMDNVDKIMELIGERFFYPHFQSDFLWGLFGRRKQFKRLQTRIVNYVRQIVEKKKQAESNPDVYEVSKKKDFLSYLIKISQERNWDDQELIDETYGMILAGYHTTATTECFCMLMLGLHQDVQEKVYKEMQSIFGDSDRDATIEDLNKMEYLSNFCKETVRLFPIAPVIGRQIYENINLNDGTFIPKGANIAVHVNYAHRDPSVWPDPLKFDPDRFLPEEVEKRPRFSYVPFSIPPRSCVGKKFAEMSMKITLSKIIRNFKVYSTQYDSIESIKQEFHILMGAADGYGVTLVPRE